MHLLFVSYCLIYGTLGVIRPWGYNTFKILKLTERVHLAAHKNKNYKRKIVLV